MIQDDSNIKCKFKRVYLKQNKVPKRLIEIYTPKIKYRTAHDLLESRINK